MSQVGHGRIMRPKTSAMIIFPDVHRGIRARSPDVEKRRGVRGMRRGVRTHFRVTQLSERRSTTDAIIILEYLRVAS